MKINCNTLIAASILGGSGGGGGEPTETILWENPDSTQQFAAGDVTISDNINNYDFIVVNFRSATNESYFYDVWQPVKDFINTNLSYYFKSSLSINYLMRTGQQGNRRFAYKSDQEVSFTDGYRSYQPTSAEKVNGLLVPHKIKGIKY